MRTYDFTLFKNGDLSQPSLTSDICDLDSMYGYAMQAVFTGNATGTLTLQGSCDPFTDLTSDRIVNWTTLNTNALAAPGSILINIEGCFYKWVRLVYTQAGGSGTINAQLHAKGA